MDIVTDTSRYTTTIQIPIWLAKEIKSKGMSYNGALIAGWDAMKERKQWNEEVAELKGNMEKYRQAYLKLFNEVHGVKV